MGFVSHHWIALFLSTIASLLFVFMNSLSVWLTASLINSILSDFYELASQQAEWSGQLDSLTFNEKLKYWTNIAILRDTPAESLKVLCLTLLGVFFGKNVFLYLKKVLLSNVQLRLITELRNALFSHIHTMSLGFFHRKKTGEITSIILNDVNNMQTAFSTSFSLVPSFTYISTGR